MNVLIIGSCVSRDIFNLPAAQDLQLSLYVARSSLASIFSPIPFKDTYSAHVKSPFQKRLVEWDIEKKSVGRLKTAAADLVIIDSIDERFNIATLPNGGRCTLSSVLMATKIGLPPDAKTVRSGSPQFINWWTEGWTQLLELLEERELKEKILVNKVFCQPKSVNGIEFDKNLVDRINDVLEKIYKIQERSLSPNQFIEYSNTLTCPDDHQWGPAPFHFDENSQMLALKKINEFTTKNL